MLKTTIVHQLVSVIFTQIVKLDYQYQLSMDKDKDENAYCAPGILLHF